MIETNTIKITINRKTGKETVIGKPVKNIDWPESIIHTLADMYLKHRQAETNKK